MDEKTKLYVFARKEVFLILVFFMLVSFISFLFGMAVGQNYSFELIKYTPEDQRVIDEMAKDSGGSEVPDLQSTEEEKAQKIEAEVTQMEKAQGEGENRPQESLKNLNDQLEDHLKEQVKKVTPFEEAPKPVAPTESDAPQKKTNKYVPESGKYTIQVGSYRSEQEAFQFADGFFARGYQPYVVEREVSNRGIWFRVSIEAFNTLGEAKAFIKKHSSLFDSQESLIVRFE